MDESIWHWFKDKLVPPLVVASFAFGGTTALTTRNNSVLLAGLRADTDKMEQRFDSADNARASECAAVQARLGSLEARLGVEETRGMAHEAESAEWKERIRRCESGGGTGARCEAIESRLRTLEEYRAVDEHRMSDIEARIKRSANPDQ